MAVIEAMFVVTMQLVVTYQLLTAIVEDDAALRAGDGAMRVDQALPCDCTTAALRQKSKKELL